MLTQDSFYRVSVKALILDENKRVLLIQEKNKKWELPGGGLQFNEGVKEALVRELHEEMGVHLTTLDSRPSYVWTQKREKNEEEAYFCMFLAYKATVDSFSFSQSNECIDSRFFNREEMAGVELHLNLKNFIDLFRPEDF